MGPLRITIAVDIDASPERLWSFVEPIERHVDWMRDAHAITFVTDQRRGVGTRFDCDTRVGPIRLRDRMTVTEWHPGHTMGIRHEGVVSGSGRFLLHPLDGGERSTFTWDESLRFPRWMGGAIGGRVAAPVLRLVWKRNLVALKRLVEATPSSPPPARSPR